MSRNKVISNAAWIIGGRIVQSLLSMIVGMFIARYLGPGNYGLINYAASLTAFLVPFMQLGLNSILVQELINRPEQEGEILGTSIVMSLCSSVLCIIGIVLFAFFVNRNETETIIVCALYSMILIFQAIELLRYWFQSKLLSRYTSIVVLCAYIVVSIYRIFLLLTNKNIYWFAFANAFDSMLIAISLLIIYRRLGGAKLEFSYETGKRMLKRSRYFIMSSLMITIFAQTDKIMLKLLMDETATGYYSAAVTCATYSGFVFVATLDSARPSILKSKKDNQHMFEKKMIQLYSIIIFISIMQSIIMTLFSDSVINILYGQAYLPASSVLKLVVWYSTFSYIGGVRSIWILAEEHQKYLWIINLVGAVTNVLLNWMLIPFWGMHGAALASILTQVFTNVVMGYIIGPIRRNNVLLFKSLNPKYLIEVIKVTNKR